MSKPQTKYQQHVAKWSNCTACSLHQTRTKVVLVRGTLPCQILFVGEAPGKSEDILGKPFVGPAGMLLNQILSHAVGTLTYALTNLVSCIPYDPIRKTKTEEPSTDAIQACAERLQELVDLASPQLVVLVGALAASYLNPKYRNRTKLPSGVPVVEIDHPAYILRLNYAQQGLAIQRAVVTLQNKIDLVFENPEGKH